MQFDQLKRREFIALLAARQPRGRLRYASWCWNWSSKKR